MNKIAEISRGIPRDIDALCEAALSSASRPRPRLGTQLIPASTASANATRRAAESLKSAVKAKARLGKPSRNTVFVGAGILVLVALAAAYALRPITPQWASVRMTPSTPPPSQGADVAVPAETPPVELPSAAAPTVQESAVTVPEAAPTPAPVQESPAPVGETSPTPPAPSPAPRPTPVAAPSVAAPSVASPALRERPTPRSEPPPQAASRPAPPRERPPAAQRPARPPGAESDGSAAIEWLFRNTPRASD